MKVAFDTNVLARCIETTHAHHEMAIRAVANVINRGDDLCLLPQVLYEYFVVCTRPRSEYGGLGMSNPQTINEIARLVDAFELIPDSPDIFPLWRDLIQRHVIVGKRAHDARIAAAMLASQIPAILTFNHRDFQKYQSIQVLDPSEIASKP